MRLRGELKWNEATQSWRVTLWSHDVEGKPFYFGAREFGSWDLALGWVLWRLGLSKRRYG